jgi:2,3-bisphosphoglycerate-independent phosphoglycerate mutase
MNIQKNKLLLIILDGWGISPPWGGNAESIADTPNMNRFLSKYQNTRLEASGVAVGLPKDEMGNSEVGHLNIGAGRVIRQDISMITESINNGSFFNNPTLKETANWVNKNNSALHIAGLVSDGGVHSHIDHLFAILDWAKKENIQKVFIHAFTDGRDTDVSKALSYISSLKDKMTELGIGKIATISGRYYAMDRDKRWERTKRVYQAMVDSIGETSDDPLKAISHSYSQNINDEFINPTVIIENSKPVGPIQKDDALIFFNFRSDRVRQLMHAFVNPNFKAFQRTKVPNLFFVTMVPYEYYLQNQVHVIFPTPKEIKNTLAEVISNNHLTQLHIAETEKYAHVTYFFNGGIEKPFPGEKRILIPSPRVATYDLKPEMSANIITEKVIDNLDKFDFMVINYANADMVGHTGNMNAAKIALETIDKDLGKLIPLALEKNYSIIITADHGNVEQMINPVTSEEDTEHSTNPVPFILIDDEKKFKNLHPGKLANIAPTILDIMNIKKPVEMNEKSLFEA